MDFGAEDEGRLSPFEDDNPKDAENTVFRAGSDNSCQATTKNSSVKKDQGVFLGAGTGLEPATSGL